MALDLSGLPIDNNTLSMVDAAIGTYRDSDLDVATFNSQNLGVWLLCDGQSSVGTQYETLTAKATVPNFVTEGTFRRQAKAGRALGSHEQDAMQGHQHAVTYANSGSSQYNGSNTASYGGTTTPNRLTTTAQSQDLLYYNDPFTGTTPRIDVETRPTNIACNVFIKVDHS